LPPGIQKIGPYEIDRGRLAAVLQAARAKSDWDTPLAAEDGWLVGRGVAANVYAGRGYIAMVIEVAVAKDLSAIRARRVVGAIDVGTVLNPLGIEGQHESGVSWGLGAALHGKMDFKEGRPVQSTYRDFRVMRIDAMPKVETVILPSDARPSGFGEHPVPVVAPALANAVFAATGKRVRTLPITPDALRALR
jgi:isoquinoline 1-oxidoreductase beta subunit